MSNHNNRDENKKKCRKFFTKIYRNILSSAIFWAPLRIDEYIFKHIIVVKKNLCSTWNIYNSIYLSVV